MIIKARTRKDWVRDFDPTRTFPDGTRDDDQSWLLFDHAEQVERADIPVRVFLDPDSGLPADVNYGSLRAYDELHVNINTDEGVHGDTDNPQAYVLCWWVWWMDRKSAGRNQARHLLVTNQDPVFIMSDDGDTIERLR